MKNKHSVGMKAQLYAALPGPGHSVGCLWWGLPYIARF